MRVQTLQEFLVLSEELNFSKTAQRFFISQSTLSRHVIELERELGCKLLSRNRQHVELTPLGEMLAERAGEIVSAHDKAVSDIKRAQGGKAEELTVGYLAGAAGGMLHAACTLFKRDSPGTSITLRSLMPSQINDDLRSRAIDLGITMNLRGQASDTLCSQPIFSDSFVLLMDESNPLSRCGDVSPAQITRPVLIPQSFPFDSSLHAFLVTSLSRRGIAYAEVDTVDDVDSLPYLVLGTQNLTVTCGHLQGRHDNRCAFARIEGADLGFDVCVTWRADRQSAALEGFASCVSYSYEMLHGSSRER